MRRTSGFARGLLHGALLGTVGVVVLLLAVPVNYSRRIPSPPSDVTMQDFKNEEPAETGDFVAKTGFPDQDVVAKLATKSEQNAVMSAKTTALEGFDLTTRITPPAGSEFARTDDINPVTPDVNTTPVSQARAPVISSPTVEISPEPGTLPARRPVPLDLAGLPQTTDETYPSAKEYLTDPDYPSVPIVPLRPDDLGQDSAPDPEVRSVPTADARHDDMASLNPDIPPAKAQNPAFVMSRDSDSPKKESGFDFSNPASRTQTTTDMIKNLEQTPDKSLTTFPLQLSRLTHSMSPILNAPDQQPETVPVRPVALPQSIVLESSGLSSTGDNPLFFYKRQPAFSWNLPSVTLRKPHENEFIVLSDIAESTAEVNTRGVGRHRKSHPSPDLNVPSLPMVN